MGSIPWDYVSGQQTSKHAVVIGAGAAGLVAARELLREGHSVTVLESSSIAGGVWAYTDEVESDPLGAQPEKRIHSSLYRDLRVNLPRQLMAFADFPFSSQTMNSTSVDSRDYPCHQEVLAYLQAFTNAYHLRPHIRFGATVVHVSPLFPACNGTSANGDDSAPWPRWQVSFSTGQQDGSQAAASTSHIETDAVLVCNGHYRDPMVPAIPGRHTFPGQQLHTHNYRSNEAFTGKRVCVIGAMASGIDISFEIAAVADQVWLCSRTWPDTVSIGEEHSALGIVNLHAMSPPEELHPDGGITFRGGSHIRAVNVIVYATGYRYSFPFLDAKCGVSVNNNRVGPVYKHTLVPHLGPSLSFLGLPFKVAPFPLFEAQARWVARALSKRISLPSIDDMLADIERWDQDVHSRSWPLRYTHMLGDEHWDLIEWLNIQSEHNTSALPEWRRALWQAAGAQRAVAPQKYRDIPLNADLLAEAASDGIKAWHEQQTRVKQQGCC
ncbi:hypothetical protein WJX73_009801 [Symbiochloris irregularis]|uniref:Flavin-containing monooxygenase n=1 Tax=Symbiochloris irregularis TaxID=706552 RepID=A0AAW1PRH9_9CHLO